MDILVLFIVKISFNYFNCSIKTNSTSLNHLLIIFRLNGKYMLGKLIKYIY